MKNRRDQTRRSGGDKDAGADADADSESHVLSFKQIMKDVTLFGAFTWKERKQMENQKAVELGGKPAKKQRLPLSVARVQMKNQKEREQKLLQEEMALGRFSGKRGGGARTFGGKRKQESRVLRSTEGFFKNGVLDVKHLVKSGGLSESRIPDSSMMDRERKQKNGGGGGKKKHGKKKGKGRKKH
ncbi:unnamed protein product [Linum trigynum]|uniref:Uncharacterized protein n=1 Tax=Linum trigynum TaxID=586398 RepID=A0AAV2E743_9ROSI